MFSILLTMLIIVSVLMIGLILLQKSDGTGISGSSAASMFGGVFTGSVAGNFLTRTTSILATLFFILCILLAIFASKTKPEQTEFKKQLIEQSEQLKEKSNSDKSNIKIK